MIQGTERRGHPVLNLSVQGGAQCAADSSHRACGIARTSLFRRRSCQGAADRLGGGGELLLGVGRARDSPFPQDRLGGTQVRRPGRVHGREGVPLRRIAAGQLCISHGSGEAILLWSVLPAPERRTLSHHDRAAPSGKTCVHDAATVATTYACTARFRHCPRSAAKRTDDQTSAAPTRATCSSRSLWASTITPNCPPQSAKRRA